MAMTLEQIREKGLDALKRELGLVGMIRFLQQFETGHGDYARERRAWVDTMSLDDLIKSMPPKRARSRPTLKPIAAPKKRRRD